MAPETVEQILREYDALRDPAGDPEQEAVRAAVLVEDVFGITLTDAEIDAGVLGSAEGLRDLVARHGVTA